MFPHSRQNRPRAFSLVELMVVIAIMIVMTVLLVPAMTNLKSAGDVTSAAYTIKGVLDQARTYAMANHTYTWVGFYEESAAQSSTIPATAGIGRIVVSTVASRDGTRYQDSKIDSTDPPKFDNSVSPRPHYYEVVLVQLGNLIRIGNVHLTTSQATGPTRPAVPTSHLIGHTDFASHPRLLLPTLR